ncbi:MAG: oxidoreductase [Jannaschia helgolandensis]
MLGPLSDRAALTELTRCGSTGDTIIWAQLGHAGAMTHPPIGTPRGPSALDMPGLTCVALTRDEIAALPATFARTACMAVEVGFDGVQVHAAHGFLLSQFLSPLFNKRTDAYGGSLSNRMRLTLEVIAAVRDAVGPSVPVAVKLNATDQLEGGFSEDEAVQVVAALDATSVDLIDISGGTYFPGAASASDGTAKGACFLPFAHRARAVTSKPLMLTGGIKTRAQAVEVLASGAVDVIGVARALVLDPSLPQTWAVDGPDPAFPRFDAPPEGGITAWYTMRLTALSRDEPGPAPEDLSAMVDLYETRDAERAVHWRQQFGG